MSGGWWATVIAVVAGLATWFGHWLSLKGLKQAQARWEAEQKRIRQEHSDERARAEATRTDDWSRWLADKTSTEKIWHRERSLELMDKAINRSCSTNSSEVPVGLAQLYALVTGHMVQKEDAAFIETVARSLLPEHLIEQAAKRRQEDVRRSGGPRWESLKMQSARRWSDE
ncbi:hypothetical protein [Blastococcus sp. SYSU DS0533]